MQQGRKSNRNKIPEAMNSRSSISLPSIVIPKKLLDRARVRKEADLKAKRADQAIISQQQVVRMLLAQAYSFDWIAERVGLTPKAVGQIAEEMYENAKAKRR